MNEENVINAMPEKDFFIRMLVKDIGLTQVVPDLVDNCVDGARRLRPEGNFEGLYVRIEIDGNHFRIADNCGGIPVEIAKKYAFRFGRPKEMYEDQVNYPTIRSIGQFGIGMKRALFKLGSNFRITSTTETSRFVVKVNVDEWAKTDKWQFEFAELEEKKSPLDECGTDIYVSPLLNDVSEKFGLSNFVSQIKLELEAKHTTSMDNGLAVSVNKVALNARDLPLIQSEHIRSGYKELTFFEDQESPVTVKLFVGIGPGDSEAYGWYIFCNGRLLLDADKTSLTGWGGGQKDDLNPRAHIQFNRFRGYAFFDSDDVSLLPWNTTKDGVDVDSALFETVSLEMRSMMRPVLTFLDKVHRENQTDEDRPLATAIEQGKKVNVTGLTLQPRRFEWPTVTAKIAPTTTRIGYSRSVEQVNCLKSKLGLNSNKEVGEHTFDYFVQLLECEE